MEESVEFLARAWLILAGVVCYKRPFAGGIRVNLLFMTPLALIPTLVVKTKSVPLEAALLQALFLGVMFVVLVIIADRVEHRLGVPGFRPRDEGEN